MIICQLEEIIVNYYSTLQLRAGCDTSSILIHFNYEQSVTQGQF